jgi:hypothetical protein
MRWLPLFSLLSFVTLAAVLPVACSNGDDSTSLGPIADASQPPQTRFEAGANCAASEDCETGLVCLFPVGAAYSCSTLAVCVAAPPATCDHPQTVCSCLAEPIVACDGYAANPADPTGTCEAGTVVITPDAGSDDAQVADAAPGPDATAATDASDAAGE